MLPSIISIEYQRQVSDWSLSPMDDICGTSHVVVKSNDNDNETQVTMMTCPFIKYHDGYEYPNLYQETDEMLQASLLIYPMAELRKMVRSGLVQDEQLLTLPLTALQVIQAVEKHRDTLVDTSAFGNEFQVDVLKALQERHLYTIQEKGAVPIIHEEGLESLTLVAFDDEFEKEELVYAIAINPYCKRITLCFRGTVTNTDWKTNVEAFMKEIQNPMHEHRSQEPTVFVHNGFHDYLFSPNEQGITGPQGEVLSEYQEILQRHLLPVVNKYPGYKIYISGHSLGGALATLFAFEIASMPDDVIPKPVSCFTFGAPYIGDDSFRRANSLLQSLGKLRHLRVCNHKDLVTTIPKMAFKLNIFDSDAHVGTLFKHTGMNLKLFHSANEPVEVSFPMVRTGWYNNLYDEFIRGWDQSIFSNLSWDLVDHTWHRLSEYNRRLMIHKKRLKRMHLNDLYSREDVVGRLVADF